MTLAVSPNGTIYAIILTMKIKVIAGCLLLAGAIAGFVIMSGRKEKAIEDETSSFVGETVSAISKDWNADELVKRAEPGLIKSMNLAGPEGARLFSIYRKIGAAKGEADCKLKDTTEFQGSNDHYTSASYVCESDYEHGSATLNITVRRGDSGGEWKVYYFRIDSPYFAELGYQRTK